MFNVDKGNCFEVYVDVLEVFNTVHQNIIIKVRKFPNETNKYNSYKSDVTYIIVNESCIILQDIIEKVIVNGHCEDCVKYATTARSFMKNQFKTSIIKNENECCFHEFIYALTRDLMYRTNIDDNGCNFQFFLITI